MIKNIMYKKICLIYGFIILFPFYSFSDDLEDIIYIRNTENRVDWINAYFSSTRIFNTKINDIQNNSPKILLKTRDGCSQTGFYLKRGYYDESMRVDRMYVVSTFNDLEQMRANYIELPFLDTFSASYFKNNHLVFIISGYSDSSEFRNERIEIIDGQYAFILDFYYKGEGEYYLCAYTALYVLEIPK